MDVREGRRGGHRRRARPRRGDHPGGSQPEPARPPRRGRDEDEAFYVLEGTVDFACGEERFRADAGALAFLPRGLPHTFLGVSTPAARVLVLLLPGGLEELFLETDAVQADALLRTHGVEIVGPPLAPSA